MKIFIAFAVSALFVAAGGEKVFAQDANSPKSRVTKLSRDEKREGYVYLFDGSSLELWDDPSDQYVLENGNIKKTEGGAGNLYTKEDFDDFVLRFEFMLPPAANNGLGLRHTYTTGGYDGMELQILDNEADVYNDLKPWQYHGSLYGFVPAKRGYLNAPYEWNRQEVRIEGNRLVIKLNGEEILNTDIAEATKDAPMDVREKIIRPVGRIAFLGHTDVVYFRNVRIKRL